MAELEQVKERLALLGVCTQEEAGAFTPLAEEALGRVERMLRPGANRDDSRIVGVAAADCARQIAYIEQGGMPASFTAGSLKVNQTDRAKEYERLYKNLLEGAYDLLEDNAFRFCTV